MFRDDRALSVFTVFLILVLILTTKISYAEQIDAPVGISPKDEYKTLEVKLGEYVEKGALNNVEVVLLRNDELSIDDSRGTFVSYLVSVGQSVKKGDPLVSYQIPGDSIAIEEMKLSLDKNVTSYQKGSEQREADIAANSERLQTLDNSSLEMQILQLNIQKMVLEYEQYKYQSSKNIEEQQTTIKDLEASLELQYVYAPYDGIVYFGDEVKEGTAMDSNTRLISIFDTKSAVLAASITGVNKIWYGMEVSVTGISDRRANTENILKGKVVAADSLFDDKASTGMVYIQFEGSQNLVGTMQRANITAAAIRVSNVLIIPASVVKYDDEMMYVYVLDEKGEMRKQFFTGRGNGTDMWVYNGLSEGQQIVIE